MLGAAAFSELQQGRAVKRVRALTHSPKHKFLRYTARLLFLLAAPSENPANSENTTLPQPRPERA